MLSNINVAFMFFLVELHLLILRCIDFENKYLLHLHKGEKSLHLLPRDIKLNTRTAITGNTHHAQFRFGKNIIH